ncbi:MAG: hypothetical protein KAI66_01700 [Lentisphaeria bacterium]|nr:hypothetical protein [Lentisphaeria bacterium]
MRVEKDYEELLELFNRHDVRYCIVGAFAVALHGRPRYTKDIDILVDTTPTNAGRVLAALDSFGFGALELTVEDFSHPGQIIQLGFEPLRIDILTAIAGLPFDEIWQDRVVARYGETNAVFIGLDDLMKAKRLANRSQDRADLEVLERVRNVRHPNK